MSRINRVFCIFLFLVLLVASSCNKKESRSTSSLHVDFQPQWTPFYEIDKHILDVNGILDEDLNSDGCCFLRYEGDEMSPLFFFSYYDFSGECCYDINLSEEIEDIYSADIMCIAPHGDVCIAGFTFDVDANEYSCFCVLFSQEGVLKKSVMLNTTYLISQLLDISVLEDGTILLSADSYGQTVLISFDQDGSQEYSLDLEMLNADIIISNDQVFLFDFGNINLYEFQNQSIEEVKGLSPEAIDVFSYGDNLFWTDQNGVYILGSSEPVLKWDDLYISNIPQRILINDSGIIYLLSNSLYTGSCYLYKLTPSEENPYPEMKTITIAGCDLRSDASLMYALETMNEGNPSCHYVLRDYYDEIQGKSDQPMSKRIGEKIRLEVASKKTPDIYFDKYRDLDLRDFCKDDYLIDLNRFLSGHEDEFNFGVLTLHQDTPYVICTDFSINCFSALKETTAGINEWNYDSFNKAYSYFDDGSFAQGVYTREELLYSALSMDINKYINYEKGDCDFHQDSFRELLKWVNDFGASESWIHCGYSELKDRTIMLDFEQFNGLRNYLFEKYEIQDIAWVGYPNAPGKLPYTARNIYAISALSPYVNESWEFIEFVLSDDCQSIVTDNPVRNSALYQRMEQELNIYVQANTSFPIENKDDVFKEYNDILHQTVACDNFLSTEIFDIVCEEANPYFYGDRSLEECIDLIETRAKIYINEVK